MHVMLLDGSYPQDIRVRKEAEALSQSGIDIRVICRWKKGEVREEIINGVRVIRIGINYSHSVKGIHDILFSIFFIDFVFYFGLKKYVKNHNFSLLHVHDLPLVKTAKRILGKSGKVVLDMHENYPEMLEELNYSRKNWYKKWKDRLFFNVKRWKIYEKKVITIPFHIIAVVDEMKEKLIREYHLKPEKISVISNYEKLSFVTESEKDDFSFDPSIFYLAYVGGISPVRGLETVIDTVDKLKKRGEKVQFLIIGNGNASYLNELKQRTNLLGLNNEVLFLGYKPFKRINYYIEHVNINIIPHVKNEHTDHTIPHKLFQIMIQKAPLLVSSCNPLKRYIESNNAGYVFEAGNVMNLQDVVLIMKSNPSEVKNRIENAYHIASTEYNWEKESEKLVTLVKSFYE
jgi:glycosyltransferase involved in cell wall biosynthesis